MELVASIVVAWVALAILGGIFYWILKPTDPPKRSK